MTTLLFFLKMMIMLLCRISCSFTTSKPLLHHQLHFLAFQRLFRVLPRSTTATEIRLLRLLQQSVAMRLILLLILHRREGLPCQTRFMVLQALRSPSLTPRIFFGWVDRYQYLHTLLLWWAHSLCQSLPKVRNLEKNELPRILWHCKFVTSELLWGPEKKKYHMPVYIAGKSFPLFHECVSSCLISTPLTLFLWSTPTLIHPSLTPLSICRFSVHQALFCPLSRQNSTIPILYMMANNMLFIANVNSGFDFVLTLRVNAQISTLLMI